MVNAALDRREVGERATEPAAVYVGHAAARRFGIDRLLRLLCGAHDEDRAGMCDDPREPLNRLFQAAHRLLEVDDVNAVALGKNEGLHSRVPASRLMPKVRACFEQGFHGYRSHSLSLNCRGCPCHPVRIARSCPETWVS